ncbi:MAG: ribbon-helix-helix domain-containing protein [Thermoplasmata archaeon]
MASETERVTVRLPIRALERLQTLVHKGEYDNISDAIRAAIDGLLAVRFPPRHVERMTVELPKGKVVELEQLVRQGDSVSLEDAIRNAVREYIRTQIDRIGQGESQ